MPWAVLQAADGESRLREHGITVRCLVGGDGGLPSGEDDPDALAYVGRAYLTVVAALRWTKHDGTQAPAVQRPGASGLAGAPQRGWRHRRAKRVGASRSAAEDGDEDGPLDSCGP